MNIILGKEHADEVSKKYVVLELDTIRMAPDSEPITAFCLVENVPISDTPDLEKLQVKHQTLIHSYQNRDWDQCRSLMEDLKGRWNQEVDSFYDTLTQRIDNLEKQDLSEEWDPVINRFFA